MLMMAAPDVGNVPCADISEFQEYMRKLRFVDDRINSTLNSMLPSESFSGKVDSSKQCRDLYDEIQQHSAMRELSIKKCITQTQTLVDKLKHDKATDGETLAIARELRQEQTKLKLLRSELNIEEIVRDRTMKAFYERCRTFYKPPK